MTVTEFASLDEFYLCDVYRYTSETRDYGAGWTGGRPFPVWTVRYFKGTGELAALEAPAPGGGRVLVLGVVPPDGSLASAGPSEPHPWAGSGSWSGTVDRLLAGYADPRVSGLRLAWVVGQLARLDAGAVNAAPDPGRWCDGKCLPCLRAGRCTWR